MDRTSLRQRRQEIQEAEQVETRNPYQPPCFHALSYIQPQPRHRRSPSLIGLRAL
jgi:hypothetical protein